MNITIIEHMLANFRRQIQIYQKLLEQGQSQLSFLNEADWQSRRDLLYDIARSRSSLMDEIVEVMHHNRDYQKEIARRMGISEFHLSALKAHLPAEDFSRIELLIQEIAGLLHQIKHIDEQCADIVRNSGLMENKPSPEKASYQNASRAYGQNKPGGQTP